MRLQLAIDTQTLSEAEVLVSRVCDLVDVVEVGTPLVIRDGVGAVHRLRAVFPDLTLSPTSRSPTAATSRPRSASRQAPAHRDGTGRRCRRDHPRRGATGHEHGGEVMVDLMGVSDLAVAALRPDIVVVCSAIARAADPRAAATALRRALGEERR